MDSSIPLWAARDMGPVDQMCNMCKDVLQELLWPVEETNEAEEWMLEYTTAPKIRDIQVGWVDTLIATKRCALCQFLTRRFQDRCPRKPLEAVTDGTRFFCYFPQGWTTKRSQSGMRLNWNIPICYEEYEPGGQVPKIKLRWQQLWTYSPTLTLLVESTEKLAEKESTRAHNMKCYDLARRVPKRWDASLMREAFQTCLHYHGNACATSKGMFSRTFEKSRRAFEVTAEESLAFAGHPGNLRVIDVRAMRIVGLSERGRYIALSYCWARHPYLCLITGNLPSLRRRGGIHMELLAPTIADSITVTLELDERFLWVDALCIIQDDNADKAVQIRQMDRVYRGAILTIVAAGRPTADIDPGLPRVHSADRPIQQDIISLGGLQFTDRWSTSWSVLRESRWRDRAWTYQEYLMSRRLLVFTPLQVRFSCESDVFSEDFQAQACVHNKTQGTSPETLPCCEYVTPSTLEDKEMIRANNSVSDYPQLVRELSSRDLSHEFDVLNAAYGLFSLVIEETELSLLCGMPVNGLLEYALWYPASEMVRRGLSASGQLFPSWSWIGWVGQVRWPYTTTLLFAHAQGRYTQSEIETCRSEWRKKETGFESVDSVQGWTLLVSGPDGPRETVAEEWDKHSLLALESCILCFSAPYAVLNISSLTHIPSDDLLDAEPLGPTSAVPKSPRSLAVQVLAENVFAGEVFVDSEYANQLTVRLQQGIVRAAFIELSRTTQNLIAYSESKEGVSYRDSHPHERVTQTGNGNGAECCNVLLIEEEGNRFYRRGAGQILTHAWARASSCKRKIWLA